MKFLEISRILIPIYIGLLNTILVLFKWLATKFSVKMVARSKVGLAISFSVFYSSEHNFISMRFLMFSIVLPNTELFISLKKSFSKSLVAFVLRAVLKTMYTFSQSDRSNSRTL